VAPPPRRGVSTMSCRLVQVNPRVIDMPGYLSLDVAEFRHDQAVQSGVQFPHPKHDVAHGACCLPCHAAPPSPSGAIGLSPLVSLVSCPGVQRGLLGCFGDLSCRDPCGGLGSSQHQKQVARTPPSHCSVLGANRTVLAALYCGGSSRQQFGSSKPSGHLEAELGRLCFRCGTALTCLQLGSAQPEM
jgi:hypothetical protein